MFKRALKFPEKSFFLLGPRGTGKSTWLGDYPFDLKINLLSSRDLLAYKADPSFLQAATAPLPTGAWVLIDEVQKVPPLLDEVHLLYEEKKLNFALSGSSARKLKRSGANLLAGRAINLDIFSLCYAEYRDNLPLDFRIQWGTLPIIVDNRKYLDETVSAYVHNYLRQEIAEEGLVRKLDSFIRFLPIAALYNGKMLSYQAVADNAKVPRPTVTQYFEILFDTLLAFKLPAWQPRLKVKEIRTPKLYFFDPGIARASLGLKNEIDRSYLGYQLENLIINEVRAYRSYYKKRCDLYYYSVSDSFEIDLIINLGSSQGRERVIALEVKLAENWDHRWSAAMNLLGENSQFQVLRRIGVYTGRQRLVVDGVEVMPVDDFLAELFDGGIF